MDVRLTRAYEASAPDDGARVLVDRVWPRGRSREVLALAAWERDAAPTDELRRWFGHDPARWDEFRRRYREELQGPNRQAALERLARLAQDGPLTLVYGAADEAHNQAVVLREVLLERLARRA
jgi:uncharacterized protein YeaO (DUF488 family)